MKLFIGDNVTLTRQFVDSSKTYHGKVLELFELDDEEFARVRWYNGFEENVVVSGLTLNEESIIAKAWAEKFPDFKFDPNTRKIIPKKAPKEMKKADNWVWIDGPDNTK